MIVCIAGEDGSLVQMVQVIHWFSWLTDYDSLLVQLVLVIHWFSWLTGLLVQMDHQCRWSWLFTGYDSLHCW